MNIQRAAPVNELLAKLIFLILPTAAISYFLLENANQYFSILRNQAWQQTLYLAAGMGISAVFYAFRFRFLPTFAMLVAGLYIIYKGLDKYAVGEFDAFFISVQFLVFAILFTTGWLVGWGFIRLRYWSVLVSASMLTACILLIAKANTTSVYKLLEAFAPSVLYAIYIIFTAEQIYSYQDKSKKFWWFLTRRLAAFGVLAALLLGSVIYAMSGQIKETVANYGGGGKSGENSMLKKNKDGSFDLKEYSRLRSSLGRSNELLFAAHIDNFFPETEIPNPLYLTAFYYTKFDTLTETFERDESIPSNDLFEPDPSKLPLFFTQTDSTVIKNSLADKLRYTVDIEVYNKQLSPNTYFAPHVGFFVQPIAIEKDFRNEFKSAFRAKGYVSALNSAYFIYNSPDSQIKKFQEQRFEVLRTAKGYEGMDEKFMKYYTYMPGDVKFKNISELAHKVADTSKNNVVDKVLAIRNYFLSKDENGEPLYKYTDNPGIPDIPSASKLMYFLFENRKGYCAYYAGATLFMLRSLGIPSRIAVGFLTVDRSDKNKGWYWYYADQAHAWVQVYFPGYGWLDFDTTVGNSDAQESPKPDGTPPMQPPRAWLAIDGIVQGVDTMKKTIELKTKHFVFHDKEYSTDSFTTLTLDAKIAAIYRDSIALTLDKVQKDDEATVVSYAEAFKKLQPGQNEKGITLIKRFPDPAPVDEVYLKRKDIAKPDEKPQAKKETDQLTAKDVLLTTAMLAGGIIILAFLVPLLVLLYYKMRFRRASPETDKAYWAYRTAGYYLNQLGYYRGTQTPMQYATQDIDPQFGTSFGRFMNIYLKRKYSKQPLIPQEQHKVETFLAPFIRTVKQKTPFKQRLAGFLNPMRTVSFFVSPGEEEDGRA